MMNRLSINEMTTYRWPFEEDVEHYHAAGVKAIGVWRPKLSDFGEERGVELLIENGLRVSNLLWAGGFTGSDGRTFDDSLLDAREAVRLAGALQAECLVVYTGGRSGHIHKHAARLFQHAITQLVPLAEEFNVTLAIEPMQAAYATECTFLTEWDSALELIVEYDSPQLKLVFDTYHFGTEPRMIERLPGLIPYIGIVHLGDGHLGEGPEQNRTRLGDGEIPVTELVRTLESSGYRGFYDLELIGEEIESGCYADLLEQSIQFYRQIHEPLRA